MLSIRNLLKEDMSVTKTNTTWILLIPKTRLSEEWYTLSSKRSKDKGKIWCPTIGGGIRRKRERAIRNTALVIM